MTHLVKSKGMGIFLRTGDARTPAMRAKEQSSGAGSSKGSDTKSRAKSRRSSGVGSGAGSSGLHDASSLHTGKSRALHQSRPVLFPDERFSDVSGDEDSLPSVEYRDHQSSVTTIRSSANQRNSHLLPYSANINNGTSEGIIRLSRGSGGASFQSQRDDVSDTYTTLGDHESSFSGGGGLTRGGVGTGRSAARASGGSKTAPLQLSPAEYGGLSTPLSDDGGASFSLRTHSTMAPYRAGPGDDGSVNSPATRYAFDTTTMTWTSSCIFLRVLHANRAFDQDGQHTCFAVEHVVNARTVIPMTAKVFRRTVKAAPTEDDYFAKGQCQALAECYAHRFNSVKPRPGESKPVLPLLTQRNICRIAEADIPLHYADDKKGFYSYHTEDTHELVFMLEPNPAECVAEGVPFGADNRQPSYAPSNLHPLQLAELTDAFSHFVFEKGADQFALSKFQNLDGFLVDPVVSTVDRKGYGSANAGVRGVRDCVNLHVCNPHCRAVALRPLLDPNLVAKAASDPNAAMPVRSPVSQAQIDDNFYVRVSLGILEYRGPCVLYKEMPLPAVPPTAADYPSSHASPAPAAANAALLPPIAYVDPAAMPVTVSGIKYIYSKTEFKWFPVEVAVTLTNPAAPVSKDSRSVVYEADESFSDGQLVNKIFVRVLRRNHIVDNDYMNVMDMYVLCSQLAMAFNTFHQKTVYHKLVHFMERHVVRVPGGSLTPEMKESGSLFFSNLSTDSDDLLFIIEPVDARLQFARAVEDYDDARTAGEAYVDSDDDYYGEHAKAQEDRTKPSQSGADGKPIAANEAIEWRQVLGAFNHFCYLRTNRYFTVSDASFAFKMKPYAGQPSECTDDVEGGSLIDPSISTMDGQGFPGANGANSAVMQCVEDHRCSALCGLLGFSPMRSISNSNPTLSTAGGRRRDTNRIEHMVKTVGQHYIFPATKYVFDLDALDWTSSSIWVRVENPYQALGMGAMRVAFKVAEVSCGLAPYENAQVAKVFRQNINNVTERDYFNEAALQNICHRYGQLFSKAAADCPALSPREDTTQLSFIPLTVVSIERAAVPPVLLSKSKGFFAYRTKDTHRVLFTLERTLEIWAFTKYNSNGADVFTAPEQRLTPVAKRRRTHILEAAEALSHYSLDHSRGAVLVCDLQGVETELTDPEIHTHDGKGLGIGNRGRDGVTDFVARHRCNFVCKSLKLPALQARVPTVADPAQNEWAVKLTQLIERLDVIAPVVTDLSPGSSSLVRTPHPLSEVGSPTGSPVAANGLPARTTRTVVNNPTRAPAKLSAAAQSPVKAAKKA